MITRREFVAIACAAASGNLHATQAAVDEAMRALTGGAQVRRGRVKLDAPALIENGNSVVLGVSVESPMTQADHVNAAHIAHETRGALHPCFGALTAGNQDIAILREGLRHPAQDSERPQPALHHRPGEDQTPVLVASHGAE